MMIGEQELAPVSVANSSDEIINQQPPSKSVSKRPKTDLGDDSFERAHRLGNGPIQYFYQGDSRSTANVNRETVKPKEEISTTQRPTFPPIRLNIIGEVKPSELSIIKSINKHFRTNVTYGRYLAGDKKTFLVYANAGDQFDRLMVRAAWPDLLCENDYTIDLPSKVPSSYSIVVLGVPTQWNLDNFEMDIKMQYPTIVKVERLFVRGGVPISKVRIDFSSNEEVKQILKKKKLIFEDENTSFLVQPYSPPIKVLRCFNCHVYNQHVASNCPLKDKPICFRCGNNHPFNPKCNNKISCANCHQDHMAGNPNCPFKIEARRKLLSNISAQQTVKSNQIQYQSKKSIPPPSVWLNKKGTFESPELIDHQTNTLPTNIISPDLASIANKLDLIMSKVDALTAKQAETNANMINMNQQIVLSHEKLDSMKLFILKNLCPYIEELSEAYVNKISAHSKEKLSVSFTQFKQNLRTFHAAISNVNYDPIMLRSSSPYEPNS